MLALWRYARMALRSDSTRKVFPVIKTANLAGLAFGGACFTALLFFTDFVSLIYLAFSIIITLWPVLFFTQKYLKQYSDRNTSSNYVPVKNKFFLFLTSQTTSYLIIFSVLSATIGFLIHFVFMNAAWTGFFTVIGMAKFYGVFIVVAALFTYGINRYIIKRILFSYDSPYSILIIPPLILMALFIALIAYFALGNIHAHEHFTLFFILLAMIKVVYMSSLFAIQAPSLRTLFLSLDIRFRQFVFPRVEGAAPMVGLGVAGAVILGLSFLEFYSLTIIVMFTSVITIVWMWSAIKLIRIYKKSLDLVLSNFRYKTSGPENESKFLERVRRIISSENEAKIKEVLKLTKLHRPLEYEADLKLLLTHPSANIRNYALDCIRQEKIDSSLPNLAQLLGKYPEEENRKLQEVIDSFNLEEFLGITQETAKQKLFYGSTDERIKLAMRVANSDFPEKDGILSTLCKDFDQSVRHAAVKAMAREGNKKFSYSLLDFIHPGQFDPYAIDAIAATGDNALDYLERESSVPGTDDLVLARIMRLYGKIGSSRSTNALLGKLGNLNDYVRTHSVKALIEERFQANKSNKVKILGLLIKLISETTYNLSISAQLQNKKKYVKLYRAYIRELQSNYKQLFQLLSLIYNPNIISALQKLFLNGSRAEISHAIELTDQYIDVEIKPLIFALLEDISSEERLKRLELYFPQAKLKPKEILSSTLTYDFNKLSLYTRACAMLEILAHGFKDFEPELVFNATHPEQLISETALFVLNRIHGETFLELRNSLDRTEDSLFLNAPMTEKNTELLLFSRYTRLKEFTAFDSLSEFVSIELAKVAKMVVFEKNDTLSLEEISSRYKLVLFDRNVFSDNRKERIETKGELMAISLLTDLKINTVIMKYRTTVWLFKTSIVNELLYDNMDLAHATLRGIEYLSTFNMSDSRKKQGAK